MSEPKPFTVTMTGTYLVWALSEEDAQAMVHDIILSTPDLTGYDYCEFGVADAECHWAQATVLSGHFTTIIRGNDTISDHDARIAELHSEQENKK